MKQDHVADLKSLSRHLDRHRPILDAPH
jgi:hypothetical protein